MSRILRNLAWLGFALFMAIPCFAEDPPDHSAYDALLHRYALPTGVDYRSWSRSKEDLATLRSYLASLERQAPSRLERSEALAYWINLYNAATLNLILEHYPIATIKDIGTALSSPWKKRLVTVEGKQLSLNEIENEIIRPSFLEPRIHFALNCAARSCPPLRTEAYVGMQLETQLEEQTIAFVGDAKMNYVDDKGLLHLSKIFDWYAKDFEEAKGSAVAFVRPYISALQAYTATGKTPPVKFEDYDWSLNEAATP
jgi:hypothetical protein